LEFQTYQWSQRIKPAKLKIELDVDKSKRRRIFRNKKKSPAIKKCKKLVMGERAAKTKKE